MAPGNRTPLFMLSEEARFKKRRDEMLIAQDRAECGDYDRKKDGKGKEYYQMMSYL